LGGISSLFGLAGGQNGTGVSGPQQANILNPTTVQQATDAYGNAQNALTQQQNFVNAVNAANGVGNQSQVFNQLAGVANGSGPNPAQAQLAQATGANVANQAALMAGQRGSNANVGLMARQAAQQGASTQQQAAGQAATLQSQQQLNALNSMGSLATNQANQQANAVSGLNSAAQGEQGQILGGIASQNSANVSSQNSVNSANAGMANQETGAQNSLIGGALNGAASGLSALAQGGMIQHYDTGGSVQASTPLSQTQPIARNAVSSFLNNSGSNAVTPSQQLYNAGSGIGQAIGTGIGTGISKLFAPSAPAATQVAGGPMDSSSPATAVGNADMTQMLAARGGKVPAMLSPGEIYLSPKAVKKVEKGADPIKEGKKVPGKPKVGGAKNDYANDTVPATLEEGGIVEPRSVTQSKDPADAARAFVGAILAKQGKSMPKKAAK